LRSHDGFLGVFGTKKYSLSIFFMGLDCME
jgi:hypothetical protein